MYRELIKSPFTERLCSPVDPQGIRGSFMLLCLAIAKLTTDLSSWSMSRTCRVTAKTRQMADRVHVR